MIRVRFGEMVSTLAVTDAEGKRIIGSCVLVPMNNRTYLLTAKHVLKAAGEQIRVVGIKGVRVRIEGKVIWEQAGRDIIGFETTLGAREEVLTIGEGRYSIGAECRFLGFPFGWGTEVGAGEWPMQPLIKGGLISGGKPPEVYVDAIANPGFSGGPLFVAEENPERPELIGIVSSRIWETGGNAGIVICEDTRQVMKTIRARM